MGAIPDALRLCLNLKHPPQHCRTHPRASLQELESNKFCRHRAVYSPAGTARNVVSSRRGDSKGGHIGVSPEATQHRDLIPMLCRLVCFSFATSFCTSKKKWRIISQAYTADVAIRYPPKRADTGVRPYGGLPTMVWPSGGHILFAQSKRIWKEKPAKGGARRNRPFLGTHPGLHIIPQAYAR